MLDDFLANILLLKICSFKIFHLEFSFKNKLMMTSVGLRGRLIFSKSELIKTMFFNLYMKQQTTLQWHSTPFGPITNFVMYYECFLEVVDCFCSLNELNCIWESDLMVCVDRLSSPATLIDGPCMFEPVIDIKN